MAVRIGKITYADWVSLPFEGGWTDTFIFRIDALACIPPFEYAPLLKRLVAHTRLKRSSASLWIQVEGPGEWFVAEVRNALKGLRLPFAVTKAGVELDILDFSLPLTLLYSASQRPPAVEAGLPSPSLEELRCLQVLSRMKMGTRDEIASLTGLPLNLSENLLAALRSKGWVESEMAENTIHDSKRRQIDSYLFKISAKGLSLALRSWGVPKGIEFTAREEENLQDIGNTHRHLARLWPAWLRAAWPQAEIWAGWSEVGLPEMSVIPDALAWGRIQGYETLFWLEVGDGHKSRKQIAEVTNRRLRQAGEFCNRSGVRLVFAQLSPSWVCDTVRLECSHLTERIAVVLGNPHKYGELSMIEWGGITRHQ